MASKDYYQVLNISSTASLEEIKKAYRKLALQYHPDTANDETFDEEKFREIQEAYTILSNTKKRQEYHYKRFNKAYKAQVITPQIIVQQTGELAKLVAVLDPHRLDFDKLYYHVMQALNGSTVRVLQQLNNAALTAAVVQNILATTRFLQYRDAVQVHTLLLGLAANNETLIQQVNQQTKQQRLHFYWERYKLLLALLVAVLLCVVFYGMG